MSVSPSAPHDPLIGMILAEKYLVEALIGTGGMGAVYRGMQLAVHRPIAIKVLRDVPGVSHEQLATRFTREAMATSALRHPNTVQVIDFGQAASGMLFLVLELLEGAALSTAISREGQFSSKRAATIGRQIAKSLAEAHELGIVHRDLKPDNVFLCQFHGDTDVAKVMDFGIAKLASQADVNMTRTGVMIGTPKYMAPEQAMGQPVGPAADLYALGIILYEMLAGEPPFNHDSGVALAVAHIQETPPVLLRDDMPPPLLQAWRDLISALLAKNPEERPQKASLVASWLAQLEVESQRHQPELDSVVSSLVGFSSVPAEPARGVSMWVWAAAALAGGIGAGLAWIL